MQKNAQKPPSMPRNPLPLPRPVLAPQPQYPLPSSLSPIKPVMSSRSPSPLNTSLESSSTQSSPSPGSDVSRPQLPAYLSHLASVQAQSQAAPQAPASPAPLF